MSLRYSNLLSPIAVGNVVFKNRMMAAAGFPRALGDGDNKMNEKISTHFSERARNGAASVLVNCGADTTALLHPTNHDQNNLVRLCIGNIRKYGSIAATYVDGEYARMGKMVNTLEPPTLDREFLDDPDDAGMKLMMEKMRKEMGFDMDKEMKTPADNMTKAQIQDYIDDVVAKAKVMKALGFEMISIHSAYRNAPGGNFWTPLANHRTDEYGGSTLNRARVLLDLFTALKGALGKDFPLECMVSGYEAGGITVEDTIQLAKWGHGLFDILHLRHGEQDYQHPLPYTAPKSAPCPNLDVTAAVKAAVGDKMLIAASAGLQDPALCESIIKNGQADLIAMCRSFICDSEYGDKVYAGRGEDVVPCVRCNKCHGSNPSDPMRVQCAVNPVIGFEDRIDRMTQPVTKIKNVAVVGGGPAGMQAAMTLAKRGHNVTLFEKGDGLGGQLRHSDYCDFKWCIKDYKDYLARQMDKLGVTVNLNTTVDGEMLKAGGFDEAVIAIGPVRAVPDIPGVENAIQATEVFGNEKKLPENCIVIGGSETGVDTGLYLAKTGHKVWVTTRQPDLVTDSVHSHVRSMIRGAFIREPNFTDVTKIQKYVSIDENGLTYLDKNGEEQRLEGKVVLATGVKSQPEECAAFGSSEIKLHFVGDCVRTGDIHNATYTAHGVAIQI